MERAQRLGVLTSGGDAPGMNAALRAAHRVGTALGFEVIGFEEGYRGLIEGRLQRLDASRLDDAARRGGTMLGSARSKEFITEAGQQRAKETILRERLGALLVVGGNGSLTGAQKLEGAPTFDGRNLRVAGLPASIDNDLGCTSMAIGVDTAMNTIVEACDRICDTASAHRRTFIIEVMGRDCGYLAMTSAVAAGADVVLIRELEKSDDALVDQIVLAIERAYGDPARRRLLVVKSEGVKLDSTRLKEAVDARIIPKIPDVDTRVTVLGHVVRGGSPSAFDRLLAARLANAATRALGEGESGFMAGWAGPGLPSGAGKLSPHDPYVVLTPIGEVLKETARLMDGTSDIAKWRRKIFSETEAILIG